MFGGTSKVYPLKRNEKDFPSLNAGPYVFGLTFGAYLLSTERIVVEHGLVEFVAFWASVAILAKKLGPSIAKFTSTKQQVFIPISQ